MPKKVSISDIDVQILGEEALIAAINQLAKDSTRRKIMRPAIREAASKISKAAKSKVPVETGLLKKSIGVKVVTYKSGTIYAAIGPRSGFKRKVQRTMPSTGKKREVLSNPTKYAHLVEFGTSRFAKKPFMRPAMDSVNSMAIIRRRAAKELIRQRQVAAAKGKVFR